MDQFKEFLEHHGGKGLKKDVKHATLQVAAEYAYAQALLDQLKKIEEEDMWEKERKDLRKAFKILRWIGRGERKADRYEKEVIGGLKEMGPHLSLQLKGKEEDLLNKLQVAEKKILSLASFYEGKLKTDLNKIKDEEKLIAKYSSDSELKEKLESFLKESEEDVEDLVHWLAAIEEILREIGKLEKEAVKDSLIKGMGIGKISSIADLYKSYGYVPPKYENVPVENLKIKWSKRIILEVIKAANVLLEEKFDENIIVVKVNKDINFKVRAWFFNGSKKFGIKLEKNTGEEIANFYYEVKKKGIDHDQEKEIEKGTYFWELSHRLVKSIYRGQGIGSVMLSLLEDCVKSFAKVLKHKQLIIIEARQVEVVFFSLKNHYLPERMEDRKRLKMLFSGNKEEIFITTASGYTNDGGELPGFIYSKKHLLGLLKHYNDNEDNSYKINDIFNNERELDKLFFRDPAEHIGNGFTIKFIKTIT